MCLGFSVQEVILYCLWCKTTRCAAARVACTLVRGADFYCYCCCCCYCCCYVYVVGRCWYSFSPFIDSLVLRIFLVKLFVLVFLLTSFDFELFSFCLSVFFFVIFLSSLFLSCDFWIPSVVFRLLNLFCYTYTDLFSFFSFFVWLLAWLPFSSFGLSL